MKVRSDGLGKAVLIFKLESVDTEDDFVHMNGVGIVSRSKWKVRITFEASDIPMLLKMALNRHMAKLFTKYMLSKVGLGRAGEQAVAKPALEKEAA